LQIEGDYNCKGLGDKGTIVPGSESIQFTHKESLKASPRTRISFSSVDAGQRKTLRGGVSGPNAEGRDKFVSL
jgi:hypothetical protein